MEKDEIREEILKLLQELHEDVDFELEDALVDDKVLDSFDLVTLVTELNETFDVEVTAREFIAENFNSLDTLTDMSYELMEE